MRLRDPILESEDDEQENPSISWNGAMLGVDYSIQSVELARLVARERNIGTQNGKKEIKFLCWDLMSQSPLDGVLVDESREGWHVVLDKGTFDAISLSNDKDSEGRRLCEGYREKVIPLIREDGIFLITSCNWTVQELDDWFLCPELEFVKTITYKSFSFGGKKGQTISSVCYRKRRVSIAS